jgi:hypothetical protein
MLENLKSYPDATKELQQKVMELRRDLIFAKKDTE